MTNIAIEHGHRNSEFSHEKMVIFQFVMLNYQRVLDNTSPWEVYGNDIHINQGFQDGIGG